MQSFKNKNNKNADRRQQIILKLALVILFASLVIYFISSIQLTTANDIQCHLRHRSDDNWQYRETLISTKAFDKMPFICRTFGYRCDPNHESLNPMQKEAMTVYHNDGKSSKNYMSIIHKYSKEYFNGFFNDWFCKTEKVITTQSLESPVCPRDLRCSEMEYTKECPNVTSIPIKSLKEFSKNSITSDGYVKPFIELCATLCVDNFDPRALDDCFKVHYKLLNANRRN